MDFQADSSQYNWPGAKDNGLLTLSEIDLKPDEEEIKETTWNSIKYKDDPVRVTLSNG
jgi:hypothetical protein